MLFDEDFLSTLPGDQFEALRKICDRFLDFDRRTKPTERSKQLDTYVEAQAVLEAIIDVGGLDYKLGKLDLGAVARRHGSTIQTVQTNYILVSQQLKKDAATSRYTETKERVLLGIGKAFGYEFSEGDLERIQTLVNELRDGISSSGVLSDEHKERLLKRLEALQAELHRRVSRLDRFWGVIIEAGVTLGRFGRDVKPLTDRIREILEIVWATQARRLGLPSTTPLSILPRPEEGAQRDSQDNA